MGLWNGNSCQIMGPFCSREKHDLMKWCFMDCVVSFFSACLVNAMPSAEPKTGQPDEVVDERIFGLFH